MPLPANPSEVVPAGGGSATECIQVRLRKGLDGTCLNRHKRKWFRRSSPCEAPRIAQAVVGGDRLPVVSEGWNAHNPSTAMPFSASQSFRRT